MQRMNQLDNSDQTDQIIDTLEARGLAWAVGPPQAVAPSSGRATYTAEELAAMLGVSTWSIYNAVKNGDCPVQPVRVGRRMVWPRSKVDRLLVGV